MNNKITGIIQLIVVVLFIFGSITASKMLNSKEEKQRQRSDNNRALFADVQTLTPTSYQTKLETTGIAEARALIGVVPEVSGRVISVSPNFAEGGTFKAGQTLFQIEPQDIKLDADRLRADIARAQTAYNIEKAESAASIAEWEQIHGNLPAPDLVARKPQLNEALANLRAAQAQLENVNLDLKRSRFSLPFDGRVLSATVEKGQYVMTGQNYGNVYDINSIEVELSVSGAQAANFFATEDTKINITYTDNTGEKSVEGIIKRGIASLDPNTRFATINLGFKETPETLIPGSFVSISILGKKYESVFAIPSSALQKTGEIWAVTEENALTPLEPNILFSDDKNVVIESNASTLNIVTSKIAGASEGTIIERSGTKQDKAVSDDE